MRDFGYRFFLVQTLLLALVLSSGARQVALTILCTTDVHGHVLPSQDSTSGARIGGMLRCATAIEDIRKKKPNVVYVDCGDLVQGTAESWLTGGRIMIRTLEWLRCDAWLLGNHEFDWGIDALAALHDQTSLNMLAGNLIVPQNALNRFCKVKPYVIKDVDGVRVAIVGLTTPGIPTWIRPELLGDVGFRRSVISLSGIMPAVRAEKPDILVLLVHQGYLEGGDDNANEVNELARSFTEFDVLLGGHRHRPLVMTRFHGVLYSQAGYYAQWLGCVDLVFDTVRKKVVRKTADFIPVDERYEENSELKSLLQANLDKAESYVERKLGVTEIELVASTKIPAQSPMQQLMCKAIFEATKADVVLHGILTEDSIQPGIIRCADIWRIIPYENSMGIVNLTLRDLRDILEENATQIGSVHFLGVYGLSYELHPHAPQGERVRYLQVADGRQPDEKQRFRVAMNSYVLASSGGRFPRLRQIVEQPESKLEMTDLEIRTAVIDYVRKHSPLRIEAGAEVTVVRRENPKR